MTDPRQPPARAGDPGLDVSWLLGDVLVVCPRCSGRAHIRPAPSSDADPSAATWARRVFAARRLTCDTCAAARTWPSADGPAEVAWWPDGRDPFFGGPLWLRAPCCGHTLWAYGVDHLDLIRVWVAAGHRERLRTADARATSMLERLPAWMTSRRHRDEVVRVADRLRATAG